MVVKGIVWTDRVDKIALEELRDKDRGHLHVARKSQQTA
jgi:hypothetical protein